MAIAVLASISVVGTLIVFQGTLMADCFTAHPTEEGRRGEGFVIGEEDSSDRVSLEEARQLANFTFNTPSMLPCGTSLERVYITHDKRYVLRGYIHPEIPESHNTVSFKSSITLTVESSMIDPVPRRLEPDRVIIRGIDEDGEKVIEVITPSSGRTVKVCGRNAFANDASSTAGGLQWWNDGVVYRITGRLPMNELVRIANSMC